VLWQGFIVENLKNLKKFTVAETVIYQASLSGFLFIQRCFFTC
jgi:hypothetical protein